MQSPTGHPSPCHHQQNPPEEEEDDDDEKEGNTPIRSEMVWIVSVGRRPELDFVQVVSPIQQETSDGVLIDGSDITNHKDNNSKDIIHTSPSLTPTSEPGVTSPAGASPTQSADDKNSSEDEWNSEEGLDSSSFSLMVTQQSQQDINEIMNTKKWLGIKSSDKSFRQQLDGIFHHDKKQKKQKNKKKSDHESSPEQEDDEKSVGIRLPEFGKENSMVRIPSSKKTQPFISRSISCDDRSPTINRKNLSQQQIDINNHANLLRRTCRFLSDSSSAFYTTSSQRPVTQFGDSNSRTSMLTMKRLARSQYNLNQNSDYVNRSQSLGDLTGDLGFALPRGSQQSLNTCNSSTSNISSGSSTKTIMNGSSRTNLRQSASRTAGGPYTHTVEKPRLNPDRHSKSFDSVTSSHRPHPKISSRQLSQPESCQGSTHIKQNGSQLSLHTGHSKPIISRSQQLLQQQQEYLLQASKRHALQHATANTQHQQQKMASTTAPNQMAPKIPKKPVGINVSISNVTVQPHQQPNPHAHLSMSAKTSRPKPICESNVLDQHRKFGSTDCINKLRPRRSLPRVPSENIDEKRRKFTELMKQRILLCSTASSNNSGNADTPLDYEVSSLLSLNELDDNSSDSVKFKPIESAADLLKFQSLQDLTCKDDPQEKESGEWKQIIPVICNESSVCSTQANRRSHSSTMDSGYSTIDTEVELYMPPARLKPVLNQNKPEADKRLAKSREFGSVDCVNTIGRVKGYQYPSSGTVKMRQFQEYSTLTSAQTGTSLRNVSRWETKSLSTQNLHSRSSKKVEGSLPLQNSIKSFRSSSNLNNNNTEGTLRHGGNPTVKTISNPNNSRNSDSMSPSSEPLNNATLHQLLQLYTLYPTELGGATLKSCLKDYITLEKKIVQLPVMLGSGGSSGKSVPKGKYMKLGGPGSAFRPVRSGSGLIKICQVSMTGIVFKSSRLSPPPVALSAIEDGDLVVEVNGVLVLDQNTQGIRKLFYSTQDSDSLQLTLAHSKRAPLSSVSSSFDSSTNEEVLSLKDDIKLLTSELDRKEKLIKQLNLEKTSSQMAGSSRSPSPVFTHCQYHQDWTKNLDSLHLGEDEFVV